jgi:hypothetical protein
MAWPNGSLVLELSEYIRNKFQCSGRNCVKSRSSNHVLFAAGKVLHIANQNVRKLLAGHSEAILVLMIRDTCSSNIVYLLPHII